MKHTFVVIVHNIRSAYNVGSIFRSADGAGVEKIYLTGYTPAPAAENALFITAAEKALAKTALGGEKHVAWEKVARLGMLLERLKEENFEIVALEQDARSVDYRHYVPRQKVALILGNEVSGVEKKLLERSDVILEIPMRGQKNSLNVSVAFGIAAFEIKSTMEKDVA